MDNLVLGLGRLGRRRTSSLSDIEQFNEVNQARPETWPELKVTIILLRYKNRFMLVDEGDNMRSLYFMF